MLPSTLFVLQQWLQPIVTFWPLWLGLGAIVVLGAVWRRQGAFWWKIARGILVATVVVVFGLRGLFLIISPYAVQKLRGGEPNENKTIPLLVDLRDAGAVVIGKSQSEYLEATVVSSGAKYEFAPGEFDSVFDPTSPRQNGLVFRQKSVSTVLNQFWKSIEIRVPATWEGNQLYRISDTDDAIIDLRGMEGATFEVQVFYSTVLLRLPNGTGESAVTIRGGSQFSGVVEIERGGPSVRIVDPYNVFWGAIDEMEKMGEGDYLLRGEQSGNVTVKVSGANSATSVHALELVVVNPHND